MPLHGPVLAELVTGAARGLVGVIADRFGGPSQAPVTVAQAQLLSGGSAGTVLSQGTAVGPPQFAQPVEAGVGSLVAPIGALAGTVIRRVAGPAAVVGAIGTVLTGGDGARPMSRRQVILAQARAASPGATAKKIIRSARECGIELAAATFGLNVLDVCFLIAQPPTRRSRGISAADMRRTRSTIRKVTTIQHQLKDLSGPIRRRK